jgi:hypothetical protein
VNAVAAKDLPEAEQDAAKKPRIKKKRKAAPAIILVFLIIAAAAVIYFNLFNVRELYIYPLLRRIPIVSSIIPIEEEADPLASMTPDELRSEVLSLRRQLEEAENDLKDQAEQSAKYVEQIKGLQAFEDQQVAFKQDKAAFDDMIALKDPAAYAAFYEKVSPENAERLYPRAASLSERAQELKKYAQLFARMDETNAAAALEELIPTDMNLVVMVMASIDADRAGEIFDQMTPANVAAVTKMMAPSEP